jgi:hypothetical protein
LLGRTAWGGRFQNLLFEIFFAKFSTSLLQGTYYLNEAQQYGTNMLGPQELFTALLPAPAFLSF